MPEFAQDGTAYTLTGPTNAPVVVLIHGLGLCRHLWRPHLPEFSKFRVLNYDLFGHGDSRPLLETASLTVYAKQIFDLLTALHIPSASLVGFSIGGMINRRFAIDYPEKLDKLVILNSPHNRGEELQQQVEARAKQVREQGTMATLPDAIVRWFTEDFRRSGVGPELVTQWREQVDVESYTQASWVLANGVRELIQPTPAIRANTLVISCENDSGSTPAMAHAIAAEIRALNGTAVPCTIVPGLRHLGLMEAPDEFAKPIAKFLASTE